MNEFVDEPIKITEETDFLGSLNKVNALKEYLHINFDKKVLEKNNIIALYGEWGSGKSSVLATLEDIIDKKEYDVIWYEAWKYENDYNNAPYSLLKYVFKSLNLCKASRLLNSSKRLLSRFNSSICLSTSGVGFDLKNLFNNSSTITSWEEYSNFEQKLDEQMNLYNYLTNKKVLIIIDDLDRCEPENIITLLSAIKLLLSQNKKFVFLFGIDKTALEMALKYKYNYYGTKSQEYLEKIFPISFNMSKNIDKNKFVSFINKSSCNDIISEYFETVQLIDNPRKIKKIFSKYFQVKNILPTDINFTKNFWILSLFYLITLHEFYVEEFNRIIESWQWEDLYSKITIDMKKREIIDGRNVDSIYQLKYSSNYLKHMSSGGEDKEIFKIVELLSPILKEPVIMKGEYWRENIYSIEYREWISKFENNICMKFINYLNNKLNFSIRTHIENIMIEENCDQQVITTKIMEIAKFVDSHL